MTQLIITVVLGIILSLAGGVLIVSLSTPLASFKELFIAFIDLICNNAIWFILVVLLFIVCVQIFKKIKPFDVKSNKQQKIDNQFRREEMDFKNRQLEYEREYRASELYLRTQENKKGGKRK